MLARTFASSFRTFRLPRCKTHISLAKVLEDVRQREAFGLVQTIFILGLCARHRRSICSIVAPVSTNLATVTKIKQTAISHNPQIRIIKYRSSIFFNFRRTTMFTLQINEKKKKTKIDDRSWSTIVVCQVSAINLYPSLAEIAPKTAVNRLNNARYSPRWQEDCSRFLQGRARTRGHRGMNVKLVKANFSITQVINS